MNASALTVEATETYRRHVDTAGAFLREQVSPFPRVGVVLDPDLDELGGSLSSGERLPVHEIPHFPEGDGSTSSAFRVGRLDEGPVAVFEGALSLQEGFTPREVVFPIRMLAEAGTETLLFVTTAGSLQSTIAPSDLVLFADHINFQGGNPLVGPNVEAWGPRFPDMTEPYSVALRRTAEQAARSLGLSLRQGIFFATLGPNRGTHAEYKMAQTLGADLVGTSVVQEVIAARHMDLDVLAVSVVTHRCIPVRSASDGPDDRATVIDAAHSDVYSLLQGTLAGMKSEEKPV